MVWRVFDRMIDWFMLHDADYQRLEPDSDGLLKSAVFPGFWLDASALVANDLAQAVAALNCGLDSPQHALFAARLAEKLGE